MEITINEENLSFHEIDEYNHKVRAILIDEQNQILICNYGGIYLLPGGSIDNNETIQSAITRELKEELGQFYDNTELNYFLKLNYFQKNYPKRDGSVSNRLIKTYYYIGEYKPLLNCKQNLTNREEKDNFRLKLVSLEDLETIISSNISNNPRKKFFQKELLTILTYLKNMKKTHKKKLIKKLGV